MIVRKETVLICASTLIYSTFYIYISQFYYSGDIVAYTRFYGLVQNLWAYFHFNNLFYLFGEIFELQKFWLGSRELAYGLIVFIFSSILGYEGYQALTIILLIMGLVFFFRKIVIMPWVYVFATLSCNYTLVLAIPAERMRIATIVFLYTALIINNSKYLLLSSAFSTFAHIQVGMTGFVAYISQYKVKNITNAIIALAILLFTFAALWGQIENKITSRFHDDIEGSVSSAILGITMLFTIAALLDSWQKRLVIIPFLVYGLIAAFNRLNLSIWLLLFIMLDFKSRKVRIVYGALCVFFNIRMIQMLFRIADSGSAFGGG